MKRLSEGLLLVWGGLALGGVFAAESNVIQYDGDVTYDEHENSRPMYLTNGTLTVAIDWDSTLVPTGATKAVLIVRSMERSSRNPVQSFGCLYPQCSAMVTKPATSVSCTFFEGDVPPRDAGICASLKFVSSDDTTTNASFTAFYQLAAGSFGAARILTVATNSVRWTTLSGPVDIHFDADWFGGAPTYASVTNLKENVYHQGLYPLNGPASTVGVIPVDAQTTGPGSQKIFRIFAGNAKLCEVAFHGGGSIIIIR